MAPHLLHHAGPLAGAALLAGTTGTLLFGAVGILAAIPALVRMHRQSDSWRAPGAVLLIFAALFTVSATVIGPAVTDDDARGEPKPTGHEAHHR